MKSAAALALVAVALASAPAWAEPTPAPAATAYRIDVTKLQPKSILPKNRLHTDFLVEINKKGQVTRVLSGHKSGDVGYDEHTYGNVLQAFIRADDGSVILGKYQLSYDYDPKTTRIRRTVKLVSHGGVNPNAIGAVDDMLKHAHRVPTAPAPAPSINSAELPELNSVMHPTPHP